MFASSSPLDPFGLSAKAMYAYLKEDDKFENEDTDEGDSVPTHFDSSSSGSDIVVAGLEVILETNSAGGSSQ